MRKDEILGLSGMPPAQPSTPHGPWRFYDREYFIITYKTDPAAIRAALPEPLEPDGSDTVLYEFIRMPDSAPGFGDYTESGIVIPALYQGEPINYTAQMYLDCEPPITGGREIWGFPKKLASPVLKVENETLVGTLDFGSERIATATMVYKQEDLLVDRTTDQAKDHNFTAKLQKPQCNLKLIPSVTGEGHDVAQLVRYHMQHPVLKGAWHGDARLHLIPHVNAPVADFPVYHIVDALHFNADLTLPYGEVLHDYLN